MAKAGFRKAYGYEAVHRRRLRRRDEQAAEDAEDFAADPHGFPAFFSNAQLVDFLLGLIPVVGVSGVFLKEMFFRVRQPFIFRRALPLLDGSFPEAKRKAMPHAQ